MRVLSSSFLRYFYFYFFSVSASIVWCPEGLCLGLFLSLSRNLPPRFARRDSRGGCLYVISCAARFYARSSWAYFSTSFFYPKRGNCTVILASSPSPSRWETVPSPYFGWRTFWPGAN